MPIQLVEVLVMSACRPPVIGPSLARAHTHLFMFFPLSIGSSPRVRVRVETHPSIGIYFHTTGAPPKSLHSRTTASTIRKIYHDHICTV